MIFWKNKVIFIISLLSVSVLLIVSKGYALNEKTHREINERISKNNFSNFSLNDYLKNQLGISKGFDEKINSKEVFLWIGDGGEEEDAGARSLNHFLNPLTDKGLSLKKSALEWATLPVGGQNSSWNDVRYYYFRALTSVDKTTREDYFALTFQGIEQVMHLVEDMSVPAHVRNDLHPPPFWSDGYEDWAKESEDVSQVNYKPVSFSPYNAFFLIPQLFDTNKYLEGIDPAITTSSNSIGLSEYTNANFFSEDTMTTTKFPYPKTDSNKKTAKSYTGPEATYSREYFLKDCNEIYCKTSVSKNYSGYLLSAVDLNDYWRMQNPNSSNPKPIVPVLDENVHKDYANLLIPRAIGYSSQVLNYFFRGQMEVKCLIIYNCCK
ncbi:MAG: hypothetical protein WBN77_08680 [Desulfobacterales bacterium]